MYQTLLHGMNVLVMEDEFLIAMDVEQICRDHGAQNVTIAQSLRALGSDPFAGLPFHIAILDVQLAGQTTVSFALELVERRIPFIFATGYADQDGMLDEAGDAFAGIEIVSKPYAGKALMDALVHAMGRQRYQLRA